MGDVIEIDDYTRLPQDGSCSKCFKNGRLIGSPQTREITPANGYRCSRKANSLEQAKEILRATNGGQSDGGNNRPSSVQPQSYNRSPPSDYGRTSYAGQGEVCVARSRSEGMESNISAGYDDSVICKYCDVQGKDENPGKCYVRNANGTKGHHWVSEKLWHELYGRRRLAEDKLHRRQLVALKTRASTN